MPEKLTARSVEKLIAAGVPGDYRDAVTRGLVLRVKAASHSWNYRRTIGGHDYRIDLGDLWTLEEARALAAELHRRLTANMMSLAIPGSWAGWNKHLEVAKRNKLGLPREDEPVAPKPVVRRRTWTWEQAMKAWSTALARDKRDETHKDYVADLRVKEMRRFEGRYVADVSRKDVSRCLLEMHERGVERTGEKVAGTVKRFFAWLGEDTQIDDSGVVEGVMAGLKHVKRRMEPVLDPRRRLRVPDGPMVGALAIRFRDPRATTSKVPTKRVQRLASLLTLYTVQRRKAVATADKIEFEPVPGRGGIWNLPSPHRKSANIKAQPQLRLVELEVRDGIHLARWIMASSYSLDLRRRVIACVEAGRSRRAAARQFSVSESFAIRLAKQIDLSGSIAPGRQGRPRGSGKLEPHAASCSASWRHSPTSPCRNSLRAFTRRMASLPPCGVVAMAVPGRFKRAGCAGKGRLLRTRRPEVWR